MPDIISTPVADRDMKQAVLRGIGRQCPRCGDAALFDGYLSVEDSCSSCALPFYEHRADDAPAWLTILLASHIVMPFMLHIGPTDLLSDGANMILWPTLVALLCLVLLPLLKGAVIGFQWAKGMHGFGANASCRVHVR